MAQVTPPIAPTNASLPELLKRTFPRGLVFK